MEETQIFHFFTVQWGLFMSLVGLEAPVGSKGAVSDGWVYFVP
jgi:hypothetical protein